MTENDIVTILLRERVRLSAYAWSIVRDTHVVEDLIQEVIVKALANKALPIAMIFTPYYLK